jgi:hypothetical protein
VQKKSFPCTTSYHKSTKLGGELQANSNFINTESEDIKPLTTCHKLISKHSSLGADFVRIKFSVIGFLLQISQAGKF